MSPKRFGEDELVLHEARQREEQEQARWRGVERQRREMDNLVSQSDRQSETIRQRTALPLPSPVYDPMVDPDTANLEQRIALLENGPRSYEPTILPSAAAGSSLIRPGKITAVEEVSGPPSDHLYQGVYVDGETEVVDETEQGARWKTATASITTGDEIEITWATAELLDLGGKDPNIIYWPLEVDDYVLVLVEVVNLETRQDYPPAIVKQPKGIIVGETPNFIVCTCA